jgi:hypothetical protein
MMTDAEVRDVNTRPAMRFTLRAPVTYRGTAFEGVGEVQNISSSGLLLERCSAPAREGLTVWLRASYFPGSTEIPIESQVVRTTDSGFAVRFVNLTPVVSRLIGHILPS